MWSSGNVFIGVCSLVLECALLACLTDSKFTFGQIVCVGSVGTFMLLFMYVFYSPISVLGCAIYSIVGLSLLFLLFIYHGSGKSLGFYWSYVWTYILLNYISNCICLLSNFMVYRTMAFIGYRSSERNKRLLPTDLARPTLQIMSRLCCNQPLNRP